jgi:hypothetical protein
MSQTDNKIPVGTIDCTPTWSGILSALLALIEDGNPEGRTKAVQELRNMAKVADMYVELNKNPPRVLVQIDDLVVTDCKCTSDLVQVVIVEIDDNAEEPVVVHDYTQMQPFAEQLHTLYVKDSREWRGKLYNKAEQKLRELNF